MLVRPVPRGWDFLWPATVDGGGALAYQGSFGAYWSSTPDGAMSYSLGLGGPIPVEMNGGRFRGEAEPVRAIKDQ